MFCFIFFFLGNSHRETSSRFHAFVGLVQNPLVLVMVPDRGGTFSSRGNWTGDLLYAQSTQPLMPAHWATMFSLYRCVCVFYLYNIVMEWWLFILELHSWCLFLCATALWTFVLHAYEILLLPTIMLLDLLDSLMHNIQSHSVFSVSYIFFGECKTFEETAQIRISNKFELHCEHSCIRRLTW